MSKRTDLASRAINGNTPLRVELIEPHRGKPPVIAIDWPPTPTVCEPAQLDAVVAAAMRSWPTVLSRWQPSEYNGSCNRTGENALEPCRGVFFAVLRASGQLYGSLAINDQIGETSYLHSVTLLE
jgi:hypothetical protein